MTTKKHIIIILTCLLAMHSTSASESLRLKYHGQLHAPEPTLLWNLFTVGFEFLENVQLETLLQSDLTFSGKKGWVTGNPRFGFSGLLLADQNWTLWANLNIEIPLTESSQSLHMGASPGSYQEISYRMPDSSVSIGVQHWIRIFRFSTNLPILDVYANVSPLIAYKVSPILSLQNRISVNYFHIKGRGWREINENDLALEPGLNWDPLPGLNINPYLSIQPHKRDYFATAWLGLWVTSQIL